LRWQTWQFSWMMGRTSWLKVTCFDSAWVEMGAAIRIAMAAVIAYVEGFIVGFRFLVFIRRGLW
jgi:hypothetical protein